jgi:hypothetical protein
VRRSTNDSQTGSQPHKQPPVTHECLLLLRASRYCLQNLSDQPRLHTCAVLVALYLSAYQGKYLLPVAHLQGRVGQLLNLFRRLVCIPPQPPKRAVASNGFRWCPCALAGPCLRAQAHAALFQPAPSRVLKCDRPLPPSHAVL